MAGQMRGSGVARRPPSPPADIDITEKGRYPDASRLPEGVPMSDVPPDRLSNNPSSPYYDEALLRRGVGIRFKGVEKTNVEEYCVSEGWVRLAVGKTLDRRGQPLTMKAQGTVEPYFRDVAADAKPDSPE